MNIFDKLDELTKVSILQCLEKVENLMDIYPKGFEKSNITIYDLDCIYHKVEEYLEDLQDGFLTTRQKTKAIDYCLGMIEYL